MDNQSLLSANHLDIIFHNRNKKYGGYELRQHYNQRAGKSLLIVLASVAVICLLGFRNGTKPTPPLIIPKPDNGKVITITNYPILPPLPKKATPPPASKAATEKYTGYKVVQDNNAKDNPTENAGLKDKEIGTEHKDGLAATSNTSSSSATGDINGVANADAEITAKAPVRYTEQMPAFDGNITQYLGANLRYPALARENNIGGKVIVEFVVNEDGSISNIKLIRGIGSGCDEEAMRVVKAMPKWIPGMQNNRHVKVYMVLPIVFMLD